MRLDISDNLLLIATCIGVYISYNVISNALQEVEDATRVPPPCDTQPKPKQLDSDAEDKIELRTLQALANGHSVGLRNAAIRIVMSRAASSEETLRLMWKDLGSRRYERRDRAINGMWLLLHGVDMNDLLGNVARQKKVQRQETYDALVKALVNVLPDHKTDVSRGMRVADAPPSPVLPLRRPPHEASLLEMLIFLIMKNLLGVHDDREDRVDGIGMALEAGLVTNWLAKYPFPCTVPQYSKGNFKKSDVLSLFGKDAYAKDDEDMAQLMVWITGIPRGMKELRKCGLTTSALREEVQHIRRRSSRARLDDEMDVVMANGEDTAGLPRWLQAEVENSGPRPRSMERSQEENRLRRRHREAIVVADRGQPLGRENILQRQDSQAPSQPMLFELGDEVEEHQSHLSFSEDEGSMPSLEEIQGEPVDRGLNESPQSFRRRISERLRQGFRSFPGPQHGQSAVSNRDDGGDSPEAHTSMGVNYTVRTPIIPEVLGGEIINMPSPGIGSEGEGEEHRHLDDGEGRHDVPD